MKKPKTIFGDRVYTHAVTFKYSDKAKGLEYFQQFVNRSHVVVPAVSIYPDQSVVTFRIVTIGGIKYFECMLPFECKEFDVELLSIKDISKECPVATQELDALNYMFWRSDSIEADLKDFLAAKGEQA